MQSEDGGSEGNPGIIAHDSSGGLRPQIPGIAGPSAQGGNRLLQTKTPGQNAFNGIILPWPRHTTTKKMQRGGKNNLAGTRVQPKDQISLPHSQRQTLRIELKEENKGGTGKGKPCKSMLHRPS